MGWRGWTRLICIAALLFQLAIAWPLPPGPGPGPGPGPTPNPDWPTPSAELQTAVAPVRSVVQVADDAKAAQLAGAVEEYLMTFMDREGLATTGALKAEMMAEFDAIAQRLNLTGAFPGIGAAVEAAFTSYFGAEDAPLDWERAKAFVSAIVWACK